MRLWGYRGARPEHPYWTCNGHEVYIVEADDGFCSCMDVYTGENIRPYTRMSPKELGYNHCLGDSVPVPCSEWPDWFKAMNYYAMDEGL